MAEHYQFHVNVFAEVREAGFLCTWEDAAARLEQLPGMIFELDGSFVVSGDHDAGRWHVDGHLFDFAGKLHRMELYGECPPATFDSLLRSVGWPRQPLVFELVRAGLVVGEQEFRRQMAHC